MDEKAGKYLALYLKDTDNSHNHIVRLIGLELFTAKASFRNSFVAKS